MSRTQRYARATNEHIAKNPLATEMFLCPKIFTASEGGNIYFSFRWVDSFGTTRRGLFCSCTCSPQSHPP